MAAQVHIKSLTIGQREGLLQRGLGERSEAVKRVVEKELLPAWLRLSGENIVQLLHHLDVGNSDQEVLHPFTSAPLHPASLHPAPCPAPGFPPGGRASLRPCRSAHRALP